MLPYTPPDKINKRKFTVLLRELLPLFLLVLIAATLRIHHLSLQSMWFDEWIIYFGLSSNTLLDYFRNLFIYLAEMAITPIYFVLAYTVSTLTDSSVIALRTVSLVPGLISIVLLYLLGRRLGGHRAGIVAALCLALSPQHIWHNQEIRPYSLLFMGCLLALLGLVYWRDSHRRRWLLLNVLANGLVLFTHLFGVLFLLPQGLYLLRRREYNVFARWAAVHLFFVALLSLAILFKPHLSEGYHPDWGLSLYAILCKVFPSLLLRSFCADVLRWHTGLWPWFESGASSPSGYWLNALLWIRPVFDWALTLLLLTGIAVFLFPRIWCRQERATKLSRVCSIEKRAEQHLLLSIIFVPSVILAVLTLITSANFSDYGHDIYATIGIYCVAGILVSRLPRHLFALTATLLVLLYGYQCVLLLPGSTRTDWRAGAAYVKQNATNEDIILDLWWNGPMFRSLPYFSDSPLEMHRVNTLVAAADKAADFFTHQQAKPENTKEDPCAWLLMETRFWKEWFSEKPLGPLLTETLRSRGLSCDIKEFPGGFNMAVARIYPNSENAPRTVKGLSPEFWVFDYEQVLTDLGLKSITEKRKTEILRTFERYIGTWPGVSAIGRITYPLDLIQTGDLALAEAMARYLVMENPSFGLGYLTLAYTFAAKGEHQRAIAAYHSARSHHLGLGYFFDAYFEAFCKQQDMDAARSSLESIDRLKIPLFYETAKQVLEAAQSREKGPKDTEPPLVLSEPTAYPLQDNQSRVNREKQYAFTDTTALIQAIWDPETTVEDDAQWIQALFDKQEHQSRLAHWMPFHKYVSIAGAERYANWTENTYNALGIYQYLITRFPFEKALYDTYDQLLLSLKQPTAYISGWKERAEYNPEIAGIVAQKLSQAGKRWYTSGNANAAILAYTTACELDTENTTYKLRLAQLFDFCGETDQALHWYALALREGTTSMAVLDRTALLSKTMEMPATVAYWKALFESLPNHWRIGMLYGTALESAKDYTKAAELYRLLGERHPGQLDTHLAHGRCLRLAGDLDNARDALSALIVADKGIQPIAAFEFIELGQAYAKESNYREAEACFNTAIEAEEHGGLASFNLGEMFLEMHQIERAVSALRQATSLAPENPWFRYVLAQAEEKQGNIENAKSDYKKAVRMAPHDHAMAERLDDLLRKYGAPGERAQLWERLIKEYPDSEVLRGFQQKTR